MDLWQAHGAIHVAYSRLDRLPVRVVTNGIAPAAKPESFAVTISIERDRSELRGSGGVLRDIAQDYGDNDVIAVANANQILTESLSHLLTCLEASGSDVTLIAHEDGTPGGLMVARCGSLRTIPSVGFVDLKEQALPQLAKHASVKVVRRESPPSLPVRTASHYIAALRYYHRRSSSSAGRDEQPAFSEGWLSTFALSERGAFVDSTARLHDAVVLRGARVERGAVVARSVVCPGAVVGKDQVILDQLVSAEAVIPAQRAH
jgi:NDP-sugar pyrophosphorylase family protein